MSRVLIFLLVAAVSGSAQISFPGQRRDPQNPQNGSSLPMPGSRRGTANNQQPTQTLQGSLRRITGSELIIEADDKLVTTVTLSNATKYFRVSGDTGKRDDFQSGDHVSVEAIQDDRGNFKAVRVTQVKLATAEERSAPQPAVSDDDTDRPRLHRAPDSAHSADTPAAQITRGDPSINDAPAAPDPDDPGRPMLRRGGSTARETPVAAAPQVTAPAADHLINQAREAAVSYSETLPNYTVKQFTTRYATEAARGGKTSWSAIDNVSADVLAENGQETYKNILINGKTPKQDPEKSGSWSSGEFFSMLLDVLSPSTDADFHGKRTSTIANRPAFRYDYTVEQPNSHWHVIASAQSYMPGYSGSIWIDKETFRVLRIEMSARNMPKTFELDTVESAVDYDYVLIGDRKFVLPVHSEVMNCQRGTSNCSRNVIEFRNYRKFGADTSITFEPTK